MMSSIPGSPMLALIPKPTELEALLEAHPYLPGLLFAALCLLLLWLVLLPFRILGFAVEGALGVIRGLFLLPGRLLGG